MSFDELLREAEEDEEKNIKTQKRRIKQRLLSYALHMKEENLQNSTIIIHLAKLKQVYAYYDITIPRLPTFKVENNEQYTDILSRDEIRTALQYSNTKMKAVITFLASSGLRRSDMCELTVRDFLGATREYHHREIITDCEIGEVLSVLQGVDDVVPCFELVSVKTGVAHISFCSVEACHCIVMMLVERLMKEEVHLNDLLFGLARGSVSMNFTRLSDRLGFKWKKTRRRFHPHALRSFFATTLTVNDVDFLSTEFLLGHKLNSVQSSYYYANPRKLKEKYVRVMDKLTFLSDVEYFDLSRDEKRELVSLREENADMRKRLYEIEEVVDMLRRRSMNIQ